MTSRKVVVPDSVIQLEQQFEQFRTTRTGRTKLPESLWQAVVEQHRTASRVGSGVNYDKPDESARL